MDTLFDLDEPAAFDRARLQERLRKFASRGIFIGGSSWKYPGWIGQIYSRSCYNVRGRFSKKLFEETCLAEYAGIFPTVCGDFAFYQFPVEAFWAKLFQQTPENFRWGLKVPEQITVPLWPVHSRYGALAGLENPAFLDFALFDQAFLRVLEPFRLQIGVLILEFGASRHRSFESIDDFLRVLDLFLSRLPSGWRYAVEVRNAEFLTRDYFACLRAHHVAHVYNAWTRMPELIAQIRIPESRTSDFVVCRALLKRGRSFDQAVRQFSPYDRVQEVNEPVRRGLREIIDIAIVDGQPAFIFINNRLEGNTPGTIVAITD